MVFQSYALYPHMTVFDNIAFPLRMKKIKKAEIKKAVEDVAERLGLRELLFRKPRELSGGQRQRVALGRAIVRRPAVFLLDEPLSNLDARLRVDMRAELKKLHRELGITVVYVTHDQAEAMALSDRIAVINEGKIQQTGTPEEIYKRPANLFVATFIGSHPMNILTTNIVKKSPLSLSINSTVLELPFEFKDKEERVLLGIRPEDVMIVDENEDLEAEVELIENEGAFKLVDFISEGIKFRARVEKMVKVGQKLKIKFPPEHLHFFNIATGIRYNL
jgi:ABC-type sugar transport system ATPase subunit